MFSQPIDDPLHVISFSTGCWEQVAGSCRVLPFTISGGVWSLLGRWSVGLMASSRKRQ